MKTRGEITLLTGKIAGWTISGDTLVGANATLDGAGSALFKSDQGPDTDSIVHLLINYEMNIILILHHTR